MARLLLLLLPTIVVIIISTRRVSKTKTDYIIISFFPPTPMTPFRLLLLILFIFIAAARSVYLFIYNKEKKIQKTVFRRAFFPIGLSKKKKAKSACAKNSRRTAAAKSRARSAAANLGRVPQQRPVFTGRANIFIASCVRILFNF